ncbi:MAG: Na/Pi cotransporter family protein [Clostridiales bacterium]|nr:Na/Pi cotransporter family protein [Clostridiales bacterium]
MCDKVMPYRKRKNENCGGNARMNFMNVLSLLGGLGLFLFGMKIMGDGLEKAAGNRLKKILGYVTHNRFLAMLAGVVITAVIQSSSATTVMVVGFVNASLLSLGQAVGVIMGANIGTTVTSLLLSVKIDFAAVFACLGLLLTMLPKKYNTARQFGDICLGLGILFVGMNTMSSAMKPLQTWDVFKNAMASVDHPILGVLVGTLITAVLQSSSASVGILQALAGEGLISLRASMFILFGQNIGTCITALIACSGTNTNAKRAAVVHLLFNLIGAVLFTVLTVMLPVDQWIISLTPDNLRLQIAFIHIIFNVVTTFLLLPLAKLLEKIACLLVREKFASPVEAEPMRLQYFDARLLKTPPIAAAQLFKEVQRMGDIALNNLTGALACFEQWDEARVEEITANEEVLDYLNKEITSCLVEVRGLDLNEKDSHMVGTLFHVVNDWERVGDHAVNVLDAARIRKTEEIKFSGKAVAEIEKLSGMVMSQLNTAMELFQTQSSDPEAFRAVEDAEEQIDDLTEALRVHHVERLKNKKCSAKNGMLYLDILTNLERIGDHAENIATSTERLVPVANKW